MAEILTVVAAAPSQRLPHHYESIAFVRASPEAVFAHVDDHARLSSHMSEPSWRMGGGRMDLSFDAGQGRSVGSHIRVSGRVYGMQLSLEETVTERMPPNRKVWETSAPPRLLVIGHYRMGFNIRTQGDGSELRVFIDYAWPERPPASWLGRLFSGFYARWCTRRMADDAARHFTVK